MCGRYTLTVPAEVLKDLFRVKGEAPGLPPRWNVAPTQAVTVLVITNDGRRTLRALRWGLVPSWAKDPAVGNRMINARAETLAGKPSFREALRLRRCLVLADGFYEWRTEGKRKVPVHVRPKDGGVLTFAGLWERWAPPGGEALETCTIVTCRANDLIGAFHERMPVIVPPAQRDRWLDPSPVEPGSLADLLVPFPADLLEARDASPLVNSPAHEGPDLAGSA